ncbi:aminoacetone oxidase family FAD-binding enzyme, partial [Candidatus Gracilibacteria bacterium]|nr:aminoacetone oxidase family FAD-binding enzyme [Candidatus Gracilibacteria bacterium]
ILESQTGEEYHIHLYEKNPSLGRKILISGGGRCNVTTGIDDKNILSTKYTRGWDFIKKSMGVFGPRKVREWFEGHGVPLSIESDARVFPASHKGEDIVSAFESVFEKNRDKITLHYSQRVTGIESENNHYKITHDSGIQYSDVLVITTGGNAYRHTGSSGDGYAFAQSLGHTITPLGPSLSSFHVEQSWIHDLSGLVFPSARLILRDASSVTGSLLLTHFGISGPLAFMTASELAWTKIERTHPYDILFCPLSDMDYNSWDTFLKDRFTLHPKKTLSTILSEVLPKKFVHSFLNLYFPEMNELFVSSISRINREKLATLLGKGILLTLLERRAGDEFVTAGGVSTDELSPLTMESLIHKNLYFAGEILNVDGYTGGYSLQLCWSSGYSVAREIIIRLNTKV